MSRHNITIILEGEDFTRLLIGEHNLRQAFPHMTHIHEAWVTQMDEGRVGIQLDYETSEPQGD